MGIYDRDYYRDSSRGFHPFDSRIQVCICLMLIYIAVYLIAVGSHGQIYEAFSLDARSVLDGEVWRIATYAFIHPDNPWAIIVNIAFLFWIGRHVEDIYGWKEFLAFYLTAGFLAGIAYVALAALLPKEARTEPLIGPGGSVTAVLFLFALHYPRRTVFYYIPIWFVVAFYVVNDTLGVVSGFRQPAAFAAHAAAAGFAIVYYQYSLRVSNWLPGLPSRGAGGRRSKPKLQIYRDRPSDNASLPSVGSSNLPHPVAVTAPTSSEPARAGMDEQLEAKLDEVLDKVKKHGQDSLTDDERAVLFRASEIYRKRRKQIGE
jgi:membrane associated rhomboid family serine protease